MYKPIFFISNLQQLSWPNIHTAEQNTFGTKIVTVVLSNFVFSHFV